MFRKIRITTIFALISAISIVLSGCSFSIVSVEKLVRPPYPSNDMKYVQEAFYDDVEKTATLLTPQTGEYRTSFVMYDLDGDKQEEALVFYLADDGNAYLNILRKNKEKWETKNVFQGFGNAVEFVSFINMNSDNIPEILIGWSQMGSATVAKYFTVHTCDPLSKSFNIKQLINENYILLSTADVDNDKATDILITTIESDLNITKAYARMFSYQDGVAATDGQNIDRQAAVPVVTKVNEIPLDGNVTSYYRIYNESTETENIFYIDAYKGDSQMITEVLVCEKTPVSTDGVVEKKALEAPLIDKTNLMMTATWRGVNMPAKDIDGDGNYEIPVQEINQTRDPATIDQAETEIGLLNWVRYRNGSLETVKSSYISREGDYYIYLPDDAKTQIKAKSSKTNNVMTFYADTSVAPQTELLHLCEFSKADWDIMKASPEKNDHTFLGENQKTNTVYAYKLTPYGQNDFGITAKYVEANFVIV